jgi:hypothetical protein
MDIDKPHQLELLREDLAKEQAKPTPKRRATPPKSRTGTSKSKPVKRSSAVKSMKVKPAKK